MLAGAAAELAAMITVISRLGSVRATRAARDAAVLQAVDLHQVTDIALAAVAIGMWMLRAWATGRGQDWARPLSAACFALISVSLIAALAQDAAAFAPAAMIAAAIVWALGLSSVVLIFTPAAGPCYPPHPPPHYSPFPRTASTHPPSPPSPRRP